MRACLPRPRTGLRSRRPDAGQAQFVVGDPLHHAPGGRGGGNRAEQLRLVAQHRQITQAVPAISHHHGKVAEHPASLMAVPGGLPATGPPP
jgi:hypothetical protein